MTASPASDALPKLLVDECCRGALIDELRRRGFDVVAIVEICPGVTDMEVLRLAVAQNRILITDDKDFGDLVIRRSLPVAGVILLRTSSDEGGLQARRITEIIAASSDLIFGHITIVEDRRYRHRPLS